MMKFDIIKRIRTWMLPISMAIGTLFNEYISVLNPITPYLLSLILILTFSKLAPKDLHFKRSFFLLLIMQIVISVTVYFIIAPYDKIIAQGAMICIITPTATTAPVMTKLLKGDVAYVISYLLICNVVMAFVAPLFFSLITDNEISLLHSFFDIIKKVWFILIFPLLFAWSLRYILPKVHEKVEKKSHYSFYFWALALAITTANTVHHFINEPEDGLMIFWLLLASATISVAMFYTGNKIGKKFNNKVAITQSLGQKNTILAIWMAHDFMNPVSSIAPVGYVVFQNLINSFQIAKKERAEKKLNKNN